MTINDGVISGTLKPFYLQDSLVVPVNTPSGGRGLAPYYELMLDISDNDYSTYDSVTIAVDNDAPYNLSTHNGSFIGLQIKNTAQNIVVTTRSGGNSTTTTFSLNFEFGVINDLDIRIALPQTVTEKGRNIAEVGITATFHGVYQTGLTIGYSSSNNFIAGTLYMFNSAYFTPDNVPPIDLNIENVNRVYLPLDFSHVDFDNDVEEIKLWIEPLESPLRENSSNTLINKYTNGKDGVILELPSDRAVNDIVMKVTTFDGYTRDIVFNTTFFIDGKTQVATPTIAVPDYGAYIKAGMHDPQDVLLETAYYNNDYAITNPDGEVYTQDYTYGRVYGTIILQDDDMYWVNNRLQNNRDLIRYGQPPYGYMFFKITSPLDGICRLEVFFNRDADDELTIYNGCYSSWNILPFIDNGLVAFPIYNKDKNSTFFITAHTGLNSNLGDNTQSISIYQFSPNILYE